MVGDLIYTQLLYPALADARLPESVIDQTLREHGQGITTNLVRWMHAQAPTGVVVHVHDLLGWWPGHDQPFTIDQALDLAQRDPTAVTTLLDTGDTPYGCDPVAACHDLGHKNNGSHYWCWPFTDGTDYLVAATTTRSASLERGR